MGLNIVSIGEILWDVFPDKEKLGGATFNFSVHTSRLGHTPWFVSAVGDDALGARALDIAGTLGLSTEFIQTRPGAATGRVDVRIDASGQPDFQLHRPAAYDAVELDDAALERIAALNPRWLYYGTLHQIFEGSREQTRRLIRRLPDATRFYDVNLRRDCYTWPLVLELMEAAQVVKLNEDEAREIDTACGRTYVSAEEFTSYWTGRFGWTAAAITRGAEGCAVRIHGTYASADAVRIQVADTVGAGDAFSAAFLHGVSEGWAPKRVANFANRVGALVASRPGAIPEWSLSDLPGGDEPDQNSNATI